MLLLDTRIIDRVDNARLKVGTVHKHVANPLFVEDRPWEPRFDNLYANVHYQPETGRYRCWYHPFIIDPAVANTPVEMRSKVAHSSEGMEVGECYAESEDGLTWSKPELGLVEFEGSTANNLVFRGLHGPGIVKDPRDPDEDRRYKMICGGVWTPATHYQPKMSVAFSRDGLRWGAPIACPEILDESGGDTHNNAIWVPELARWVAYTRVHRGEPFERHPSGQRTVARTESEDFIHWSEAVPVLMGERAFQTYSLQVFRCGDVYLGLVMIIHLEEDRVHCELAWSPDALNWERIDPDTPLISNSETKGTWDWGCVYAASSPIQLEDEMRIYYGGSNDVHRGWRQGAFMLATMPTDRWAGYEPVDSSRPGRVVTEPQELSGALAINADAAGGSVVVKVLDEGGREVATSRPVSGDDTGAVVPFETAGEELFDGRPMRLSFELRNARLYSYAMTD